MKEKCIASPCRTRPVFDSVSVAALFILLLFFVGQFLLLGEMSSVDTKRIIAFSSFVSPFYPWLPFLFRSLFGSESFHFPLILFQNILNAWAVFSLCEYLSRVISLPRRFLFLFAGTFAACFAAQIFLTYSHNIVINGILTEGLALPLYFLLFKYLLDVLLHREIRSWYVAAVLSFLLYNTRGQLAWVLIPLFMCGFWGCEKDSKLSCFVFRLIRPVVVILAVFFLSAALTSFNNRMQASHQEASSLGSSVLLSTAVYCSDSENLSLFAEDPVQYAVFEEVNTFASENQTAQRYAPAGLYNRFSYFSDNYDSLKAAVTDALQTHADDTISSTALSMSSKLILANPGAFFSHCGMNLLAGLVRSAALFKPGFTEAALLAYLAVIIILIMSRRRKELFGSRMLLMLALICTLLNSLFVSFGVFALSRYMFYNLPLLYTAAESTLASCIYIKRHPR